MKKITNLKNQLLLNGLETHWRLTGRVIVCTSWKTFSYFSKNWISTTYWKINWKNTLQISKQIHNWNLDVKVCNIQLSGMDIGHRIKKFGETRLSRSVTFLLSNHKTWSDTRAKCTNTNKHTSSTKWKLFLFDQHKS